MRRDKDWINVRLCTWYSPRKTSILGHSALPKNPADVPDVLRNMREELIKPVINATVTSHPGESHVTPMLLPLRLFLVYNISKSFVPFSGVLASFGENWGDLQDSSHLTVPQSPITAG